jgi:TetR/AcrR family transcriptional regulator, lmrAB and yxaGH operons repressor
MCVIVPARRDSMQPVITMKAREKMVVSAALLMRKQGLEATSFSQVLEASGAPRGSIYHHFPGGKTQLMEEATRYGGEFIATALRNAFESGDPHAALDFSEAFWHSVLEESDFKEGCPIVTATVDAERAPEVREAAGKVFVDWAHVVAEGLERHGVPPDRARSLGSFFFAAVEGAIVLARAQRSFEPLDRTFEELRRALDDALGVPRA